MMHSIERRPLWLGILFALGACAGDGSKGQPVDWLGDPVGDGDSNDADGAVGGSVDGSSSHPSEDGSAPGGDGDGDGDGDGPGKPPSLLGSTHGGHVWTTFCEGKPDDAELPVDPRTLVQPGVNEGKAVYFNAFWVDCREGAAPEDAAPTTCGEYRARIARAIAMDEGGRMTFFGGDYTDALLTFDTVGYNNLWQKWGFRERPADYDQLLSERWGLPLGEKRNPYPLIGEDPNETNGGSGQLPVALTQLRDADGTYTGKIGMNCNWCHSGKVGEESDGPGLGALYGNGNSLVELGALFGDYFSNFPIAANKVRGTGDILLYPAIAALDFDRAGHYNGSLIAAPSQGSVDYPSWWNMGSRTRRFHDGSFAMDDARPVMGFFMPIVTPSHLLDIGHGREWIEKYDQDVSAWVESIKAPKYPGPVNTALAEEGAVLFHTKNLWDYSSEPAPEGGNGSCASCHGVYSERYALDSTFLDRPELRGIAAYVTPLEVIKTDPARANSLNEGLQKTLKHSWWGYGTNEEQGKCFGVVDQGGYLAPPLHGVWATAPYLHNGSVPNVWEVLKPSTRPKIWERVSAPPPPGKPDQFTGFDTDLHRAYDHEKLGWNYETYACGQKGTVLDCTPDEAETSPAGNLWFTWNIEGAPMTWTQMDDRKIYNTHRYSQGNQGHDFGEALSDSERMAIIEYLKTL